MRHDEITKRRLRQLVREELSRTDLRQLVREALVSMDLQAIVQAALHTQSNMSATGPATSQRVLH